MADAQIHFVSLGMVILDEIRFPNGDVLHCVGGSGAYSTLGARIMTDPAQTKEVGSLIMAGHDFPDEVADLIRSWDVTLEIDVDPTRQSTRGLLEYQDEAFGRKTFRYLTTPLQPTASSLPLNLLASRSFHLLFKPDKVITEVVELMRLRNQSGISHRPILVWEPFPSLCTAEHLNGHIAACRQVDVFSPNHLELLGLCGMSAEPFNAQLIEECAQKLLKGGSESVGPPSPLRAIVVRAGEKGCLIVSAEGKFWLRPYLVDSSKVVDATGGGNTFLGGFTVALERTGSLRTAAAYGNVAASFAIEQIGLPKRIKDAKEELWNNENPLKRLELY